MENGWVFKYPPWVLAIFLPFGFLPEAVAKLLWGLIQIGLIAYSYRWVQERVEKPRVGFWVLASFWFIFAYHALAGQMTLAILAVSLWAMNGILKGRVSSHFGALFFLTSKIFPVFSWVGFRLTLRTHLRAGLISGAALLALCSLFSWICMSSLNPWDLLRTWIDAAGSSSTQLTAETTRGWRNQGFPAIFGRILSDRGGVQSWDIPITLLSYLGLGLAWMKSSKRLSEATQWAGWLGLAAAIHPLSWFHSFVLSYPLAAFSIDQAWTSRNRLRIAVAIFGVFCITLFTKVWGPMGVAAELASVKSLGTLICLASFRVSKV